MRRAAWLMALLAWAGVAGAETLEERVREVEKAVAVIRSANGPDHFTTIEAESKLATLYAAQGKYDKAEPGLRRMVTLYEKFAPDSLSLAEHLFNLGGLYKVQHRYDEAEPLLERALRIRERNLESDHPDHGNALLGLGMLYVETERLALAEPLLDKSLRIHEKHSAPNDTKTAWIRDELTRVRKKLAER